MRHLKKFESLEKLKKEKLFLSDKDFKQAAEEFEEVMDCFLEITDKGYEVYFRNSYGHGITLMSYQDYLDQNEDYQEFIHGTKSKVGLSLGFEVFIGFEFDCKRSGKLYVGGFQIRKPEDRSIYSYYFDQQETAQIIDDMVRQEKDHPQFRLSRKRGPGLGFVISLKD
jgi:hypothetical protein